MRISGITVIPTPKEIERAANRLENMMSEFLGAGLNIEYNFEVTPDPNSPTNVQRAFWHMISTNLAIRLIPDFNKQVPQTLVFQASQSYSVASSIVAAQNIREVPYPNRQPRGVANELRTNNWERFYRSLAVPPTDSENEKITAGDVNDYQESFDAYLNTGETITLFVISSDNGLDILSSSNDDPLISYRIKGVNSSTATAFQQVQIVITTSTGRIETRLITFELFPDEPVGGN